MPRPRRNPKARTTILTSNQRFELILGWNITPYLGPNFRDDAHRRQAWKENREAFLEREPHPGRRPWAFWRFEAPPALWAIDDAAYPSMWHQVHAHTVLELRRIAWLLETGQLGDEERERIITGCNPGRTAHPADCERCLEAKIARGEPWDEPPVMNWWTDEVLTPAADAGRHLFGEHGRRWQGRELAADSLSELPRGNGVH